MGDGDVRLTVWQNLLLSGIPLERVEAAQTALLALGLDWRATSLRAGLVACTGSRGCKFANADTKAHALAIARHVDERLALVQEIWDSILTSGERPKLSEAQLQELRRRAAEDDADPDATIPWEQVKAQIQTRFMP